MKLNDQHYVYFLESLKDGSYYIGTTGNVEKRFKEHNSGNSKSTAPKKPWILKRVEKYNTINEAYRRERFLKAKKSKKIIDKIINSKNSPDVFVKRKIGIPTEASGLSG